MSRFLPVLLVVASCAGGSPAGSLPDDGPEPSPQGIGLTPLTELSAAGYKGLPGGLYPGGLDRPPADHAAAGLTALAQVQPLDFEGRPDPDGAIVLISVGMSNTSGEFCCREWNFMALAAADPAVDRESLVIVNGARGGQTPDTWDEPEDSNYEYVSSALLRPRDLSSRQVQIAWVKEANALPTVPLPASNADAYELEAGLGRMVRAMKVAWPNLRIVFFSSRIFAGYARTGLNPEPYAYESGFSVSGVIAAQIEQSRTGRVDPEAGDVSLAGGAPWLAWGPYMWADGPEPREDGLVWLEEDFREDGTHPAPSGQEKVARMLLDFFKTSPYAQCWFLGGGNCQ